MGGKYKGRRADAFIFDLDGTLIDSGPDIAASANFARTHLGLGDLPQPVVIGYVGDGVVRLLERTLGHDVHTGQTGPAGRPVTREDIDTALAVFLDHYGRHLLDTTRLYPGVLDILARYRAFPLMVATNKPGALARRILSGLHVADAFDRIIGGDETPARKPDPAHLQICLEGLDLDPARVAVVGDSPNDIAAARALGAISVGCTYGLVAPGLVKAAGPDLLLDSLTDLNTLFPSRGD